MTKIVILSILLRNRQCIERIPTNQQYPLSGYQAKFYELHGIFDMGRREKKYSFYRKEEQQKLLNSQQIPKQQNQKIKSCCSPSTTKLPLSFSTSASSSSTSSFSSSLSLNGPTPSIKGQKINGGTVSATISSSSGISASMSASLASASSTNLITPPPSLYFLNY